ncbi:MAG TPA: FAD-binding oxidoreductase [Burkholderiaceae bacterium]|nr:FAD-binding oxidoreductase [Burkholderiaceae bacterium]
MSTTAFDVIVVGAGIAGASVAAHLAPHLRVALLEREPQPGWHSTGRSAAMFMESYGPAQVRALTRASRRAFEALPGALAPRGALFVGRAGQADAIEALQSALATEGAPARRLGAEAACALVPALRAEAAAHALLDPSAADLDVHAVHQHFLRQVSAQGSVLKCDAEVTALSRTGADWTLALADGSTWRAAVVVNAAGAWADELAARAGVTPLGLQPRRRSAFTFAPPAGVDVRAWPCVAGIDEDFYFKPDAGVLLGSPANADPVPPHDVVAEELDVATGIARIEEATTLAIRRPLRTWAGLRSFVADGALVGSFDDAVPGFFWCCGQGGYGIQTSPAMGAACAARILGQALPPWIADEGLAFDDLRCRR